MERDEKRANRRQSWWRQAWVLAMGWDSGGGDLWWLESWWEDWREERWGAVRPLKSNKRKKLREK